MVPDGGMRIDEGALDDLALEALAEAYARPAPARLRERLMAAVTNDREREQATRRLYRTRMVGALAASLALGFGSLFVRELQHGRERGDELASLRQQNGILAARLDEQGQALIDQRRVVAGLHEALESQSQVLRLVGGPQIRTATLAPPKGLTGAGRVLVDAATGDAAIVLSGLAPAAEGRAYELWAIRGKKPPEPAGMVDVSDEHGGAMRVPGVPRPAEVTAFAVSIEPPNGSASPTGPIVLVGTVS